MLRFMEGGEETGDPRRHVLSHTARYDIFSIVRSWRGGLERSEQRVVLLSILVRFFFLAFGRIEGEGGGTTRVCTCNMLQKGGMEVVSPGI